MGLAASQTRFLQLTARKSNIEFQGQQLNQQRLLLANESAGLYQDQLSLQVPVVPASASEEYMKPAYEFYDAVNDKTKTVQFTFDRDGNVIGMTITYTIYDGLGNAVEKVIDAQVGVATGSADNVSHGVPTSFADDVEFDPVTGRLIGLNISVWDISTSSEVTESFEGEDLSYAPIFDDAEYEDDMNKYEYQKTAYDYEIERLNAETAGIQNIDRSLELKMQQLDTEHKAIMNEIEAVQKVIRTNIDSSFKTFST